MGAHYASPDSGRYAAGQAYVIYGKRSRFSSTIELSSLKSNDGFTVNGIGGNDHAGGSVSSGDINGDGIADLIVGAHRGDSGVLRAAGQAYVVYGNRAGFPSSLELSKLNGADGFSVNGIAKGDTAGTSVASGDMNGDGIADLILGAVNASPAGKKSAGQAYVVYGNRAGFSSSLELSKLNGSNGFIVNGGSAGVYVGSSVSSGDINGDGLADLIVGAGGKGVYVAYGPIKATPATTTSSTTTAKPTTTTAKPTTATSTTSATNPTTTTALIATTTPTATEALTTTETSKGGRGGSSSVLGVVIAVPVLLVAAVIGTVAWYVCKNMFRAKEAAITGNNVAVTDL